MADSWKAHVDEELLRLRDYHASEVARIEGELAVLRQQLSDLEKLQAARQLRVDNCKSDLATAMVQLHVSDEKQEPVVNAPPQMLKMVRFEIDTATSRLNPRFRISALSDILLESIEEGDTTFQTSECWMTETEARAANNWPIWRTTCFRKNKDGDMVKQFAVYYHLNKAIVEHASYYSYDGYVAGAHHNFGISENPENVLAVMPKLLQYARQLAKNQ